MNELELLISKKNQLNEVEAATQCELIKILLLTPGLYQKLALESVEDLLINFIGKEFLIFFVNYKYLCESIGAKNILIYANTHFENGVGFAAQLANSKIFIEQLKKELADSYYQSALKIYARNNPAIREAFYGDLEIRSLLEDPHESESVQTTTI